MSKRVPDELREDLGRKVREAWLQWARSQPNAKRAWLEPWSSLDEKHKEVDRRMGEALFCMGWNTLADQITEMVGEWVGNLRGSTQAQEIPCAGTPLDQVADEVAVARKRAVITVLNRMLEVVEQGRWDSVHLEPQGSTILVPGSKLS